MSSLKVERNGEAFGIAGNGFTVTFPDGVSQKIFSPPWHDMESEEEFQGAVKYAEKLWAEIQKKGHLPAVTFKDCQRIGGEFLCRDFYDEKGNLVGQAFARLGLFEVFTEWNPRRPEQCNSLENCLCFVRHELREKRYRISQTKY